MPRPVSSLLRHAAGHGRRAVVAAVAVVIVAAMTVPAVAAAGSQRYQAMSSADRAAARPAAVSVAVLARWDWHAHVGMGPTQVSGPVTHPGADHAGAGLERLGHHRRAAAGHPAGPAAATPLGLDVSAYQPGIDWTAVRARGARFAYVKATEGTGYVSPQFAAQYTGSFNAGLIRGAYHFALPDRSGGAAQADFFIGNGGGWSADGRTLPGALDIEYNPYGPECYGLTQAGMRAWIGGFLGEYQARTSRWPVIYSTTDWWRTCTGNYGGFAGKSPLWIACYCGGAGPLPAGWPAYTIWQDADSGAFPGDHDVFGGNLDGLLRFAAGAGSDPAAVLGSDGSVQVYLRGTSRAGYVKIRTPAGAWSAFRSVGGTWPANVTAIACAANCVYVFAVGVTGHLESGSTTGGVWSGWHDLGTAGGGLQGMPAAVRDPGGIIRVYVRGADGHLYRDRLPPGGTWSGLASMGGTWPANVAAIASAAGPVYVVAVAASGRLTVDTMTGGVWSGWRNIGTAGGGLQGVPAIVQDLGGTVRVFVRGVNGHLYAAQLPPGGAWSGFSDLGGTWPDNPAAMAGVAGYGWVYAVGTNGALYERHLPPGGSWSTWVRIGGQAIGVPAAVQDLGGTIRVYLRGVNGHLYEIRRAAGGVWSAPADMGGALF